MKRIIKRILQPLAGEELVRACSDKNGNINWDCSMELFLGYSIGRQSYDKTPVESHVSVLHEKVHAKTRHIR